MQKVLAFGFVCVMCLFSVFVRYMSSLNVREIIKVGRVGDKDKHVKVYRCIEFILALWNENTAYFYFARAMKYSFGTL